VETGPSSDKVAPIPDIPALAGAGRFETFANGILVELSDYDRQPPRLAHEALSSKILETLLSS